ncbi:MAG TPA: hypothetical protein VHL08_08085 [Dongiaceae bacterium]|nr:hypothetical protein [Dongiaceae bacterium]
MRSCRVIGQRRFFITFDGCGQHTDGSITGTANGGVSGSAANQSIGTVSGMADGSAASAADSPTLVGLAPRGNSG